MTFQPVPLISPGGVEWTATTAREYVNLVYGQGYRLRGGFTVPTPAEPLPDPAAQPDTPPVEQAAPDPGERTQTPDPTEQAAPSPGEATG